jgi:hypothetical protein
VFTRCRVAVFVDGCFWHACPEHGTWPKANADWWREKIERNVRRDRDTDSKLEAAGWHVARVWEHEDPVAAADRVQRLLQTRRASALPAKIPGVSRTLVGRINAAVASVDPSAPSVSKWRPLRDLLAEALGLNQEDVYVATVSKAGNFDVRFGQSPGARDASVHVAMCNATPERDISGTVKAAESSVATGDADMVLIFDQVKNWSMVALVKRVAHPVPPALAAAYSAASVVSV